MTRRGTFVALCGGVGGAKLAFGLNARLGDRLTIIANTGDDFTHLGLHISPDIDTILYTLSARANRELGWGRADESWNFMSALAEIGGETWFRLGDRDLALHIERTRRLGEGQSLSEIVQDFASRFGIASRIAPMSDHAVSTLVDTDEGLLPFQHYFVRRRCEPRVLSVSFHKQRDAAISRPARAALEDPDLEGIIVCPSNPYLSIDPILSAPGMTDTLRRAACPIVAVSPLVGNKAVKGPTAKLMGELGLAVANRTIAAHYHGLIDALIVDESDRDDVEFGARAFVAKTLMLTDADRLRLADDVLHCIGDIATAGPRP